MQTGEGIFRSNPTGTQIYPSDCIENHNPQTSSPIAYSTSSPSNSSSSNQQTHQQPHSYCASNTSHGQGNPDVDPPSYDEATVNNARRDK